MQSPGRRYQYTIPLTKPPRLKAIFIMPPQVTAVGSPSPIKLTDDSVSIQLATDKIYLAEITSVTFGKICLNTICLLGIPRMINDSTKLDSFNYLTLARTALAVAHHPSTAMMIMIFFRFCPKKAEQITISGSIGISRNT